MTQARLLGGRYQVGELLGYGGMAEVHKGRDLRLGRDVAIKMLRTDLARDATFQERFRREAQNSAALNHPAIVAVYDTGEADTPNGPLPYIVMEYVDGVTLRDIVQQPPNDEVCSSVSIDSSRTTAEPPLGSKCSTELTGSCRIHTATDSGCLGRKM